MKKKLLLLFLAGTINITHAQQYLGIRNSNYSGILGSTLNPSSMIESRLSWDINLGSGTIDGDNNFLYIPKDSLKFFGFGNIWDRVKAKSFFTRFEPGDPNKTYDFSLSAEGLGPSFMFKFGKRKNAVGFFSAARFYIVANDVPGHQGQEAYFENRDSSLYGQFWSDGGATFNTVGWFEYGGSYARDIYEKGKHQLNGGFTVKYLQGVGAGFIKDVRGSYDLADDHNLFFSNASIDYGRTDYGTFDPIKNYNDLIHGKGWGGSIGFTYVMRRDSADYTYQMDCKTQVDPNKSNYIFRIGLSLTDIGKIKFDKGANTYHVDADSANWLNYRGERFNSNSDFDRAISFIFTGDSAASFRENSFTMALPTSLNLQVDWNVYKNFYLNGTFIKGFRPGNGQGAIRPDVYSLTPRYETKWFEVSVPLSLVSYHHLQPRVGLCVRAGYFFVGSDALGGLMGITDLEGGGIYGGVHIYFPKHRLRDDDGDLISNKNDSCSGEKGNCLTHGCPDKDNDGTIDKLDRCPDQVGPAYLNGCPDRDNDSIADLDDSCPDAKGLREFNGCPDTDGDGIPDAQDSCVTVKGLAQFNGCPDTDGDGIPDNRDDCPTEIGLAQFRGCPDRDGDGVPDKTDKCPDVPGLPEYDGCPPVIPAQEIHRIELSSQSILFRTGSNAIEPNVYQVLDQIAAIMTKYPFTKWRIEGYADITGSVKVNLDLTTRRAEAVKDYLVKKGVKPENLSTYGYGKTKFIATNKTAAGRAKNRRVEIRQEK